MKKIFKYLFGKLQIIYMFFIRYYYKKRYEKILSKLKSKDKLNIVFLVGHPSQWKYKELYRLFEESSYFNPSVVVINENTYFSKEDYTNLDNTYKYFKNKAYNVILGFDKSLKKEVDIKSLLSPDIVFYSRVVSNNSFFNINYFNNSLTCYVPYSFHIDKNDYLQMATPFHQFLWRQFVPTNYNLEEAKRLYSSENIRVVGYPGCDSFLTKRQSDKNNSLWKNQNNKKLIWAPHHTIEEGSHWPYFSTFLKYSEFFITFAKENKNKIDICFKPHPALKQKLYYHEEWGKEKTDKYYDIWRNLSNAFISEGEYEDLFSASDAMILDSVSFTAEYLYLQKPYCFLTREDKGNYKNFLNKNGEIIFDCIYKASDENDIKKFIEDIVINDSDYMQEKRRKCLTEKLGTDDTLSSQKIFNDINSSISHGRTM